MTSRSYIVAPRLPFPAIPLLAAGVFLLYALTLAPTFSWGDSADLPLRVYGEPGAEAEATARDYVLYRLVGQLFLWLPVGDVADRVNLLSATFSVGGVVAVFMMVWRRTRHAGAAWIAALGLAVSHTWWWMSVVSEVYTFAGCLILGSLWLWLEWTERGGATWLLGASAVSGLAASAHGAGALLLIPVGWHLIRCRRRLTPGLWVGAVAALLTGSGFLMSMTVEALMRGGVAGLQAAIDSANPNVPALAWSALAKAAVLMLYQYPVWGALLAGAGVFALLRERAPWDRLLLGAWVVLMFWAALSRIPDVFNAYCLAYALLAPMLGVGAAAVLRRLQQRGSAVRAWSVAGLVAVTGTPVLVYTATPAVADALRVDLTGARRCPERNNNWYFLYPPKNGDDGPRRYAEAALDAAGAGGVIVADYTLWRPLRYLQQVEGRRPDVLLQIVDPLLGGESLPQFVKATLASRPVYLAAGEPPAYYDLPLLQKSFDLEPVEPLVQLLARP